MSIKIGKIGKASWTGGGSSENGSTLIWFCTGRRIAASTPSGWTVIGESDPPTEDTVTIEPPKPPTNPFYPKGTW